MNLAILIAALITVESNGNNNAIGDNGKAYGCLQLHANYIKDVNRITKSNFMHNDAFKRQVAAFATIKYLNHYGKHYEQTTGNPVTYEVLAKIHNGGPNGWKKQSTEKYWQKVKKHLK